MRNTMIAILAVMISVLFVSVPAMAAPLSLTKVDFYNGGQIKSGSFLTMCAELEAWANGNVGTGNVPDSGITFNLMGKWSVNRNHIAPQSIGSVEIDSGAIMYDTQIGFNLSQYHFTNNVDTKANAILYYQGFYIGDGNDSRVIQNTYYDGTGDPTGDSIAMHLRKLTIHKMYVGATDPPASFLMVYNDNFNDSFVLKSRTSIGTYFFELSEPLEGSGLWAGAGNRTLDYNGYGFFRVNSEGTTGEDNCNVTGDYYYWEAFGY